MLPENYFFLCEEVHKHHQYKYLLKRNISEQAKRENSVLPLEGWEGHNIFEIWVHITIFSTSGSTDWFIEEHTDKIKLRL